MLLTTWLDRVGARTCSVRHWTRQVLMLSLTNYTSLIWLKTEYKKNVLVTKNILFLKLILNLLQTRASLSTNSIIDNTSVLKLLVLLSLPFKVLPVCILYKNPLMFLVFKLSSQRRTTDTFMIFIIKLSAKRFFSESAICNVTVTVVFVLSISSQ